MSFVAEAIVSATIEMLVNKLVSEGFRLFQRQEQIRSDLNKWQEMLLMIKAVLTDAEEKQMEDESVKLWLSKLQNLAFDVEDMLGEFEYEALRRKLVLEGEAAADQPSTSKFRKLIPTCCTSFTPQSIQFDCAMMSRIKEITVRFNDIALQKDQLGLGKKLGGQPKQVKQRRDTTSLVNKAKIYGREKEKKKIVELLLRDDLRADDGFSVIPITGMGGLGKTTLVQLVYNDDRVENYFDLKVWVCVSEDFDISGVTRTTLSRVTEQAVNDGDLNSLQEKLKKHLSGKKFLLVLDDVWNENYNLWSDLCPPLEVGALGSKIIVTTRSQEVATMMGNVLTDRLKELSIEECPCMFTQHSSKTVNFSLRELSIEECLCIFTQHSLGTINFSQHPHLEDTGNEIVRKCKGLPLAAKTLGGILRGKNKSRDWTNVLNSKIWDLPEEKCDILPALRVSYYYLPSRLKQCFACCSLFPKDYEFQEEEIILFWMAEGLLHDENGKKKMEDLGSQFFHELYSRSFLQQSSSNASQFVMHDLINDLAQWAAGNLFLRMEDTVEDQEKEKFSKILRHLSYTPREYDSNKRFEAFYDVQHLRTFFAIPQSDTDTGTSRYLACNVVDNLLRFPRLRVFSLRGYRIMELPTSIGDLKHLQYLDLSYCEIETLPESINKLYNLETLFLENCSRLKKLCANMGNLIKLRHLNNSDVDSLEEMPLGIGKLTRLHTLCSFVVGKDVGSGLQELKFLKHLRKKLQISGLENVKKCTDAVEAEMNGKINLESLLLEWGGRIGRQRSSTENSRDADMETRVLDMLKPHQNLVELTIRGYGGTKFPIWLGNSSFSNLVLLKFEGCGLCTSLPSVGQLPVLKQLYIRGMSIVKSLGPEFYGNGNSVPFPSLETLEISNMDEWQEWIPHSSSGQEVESFPRLRDLSLLRCPKLVGALPKFLNSLTCLHISKCGRLVMSVPSLPTLCKLKIDGCENVVWESKIDLSLLKSVVTDVPNQESLAGLFKQARPKLEELHIGRSGELKYLWRSGDEMLQGIGSLHKLTIRSCPILLSLVAEEEHDQQPQGLSCRLQRLSLSTCKSLVKLPQELLSLSSLQSLFIDKCHSLVSFPETDLPPQLRQIEILACDSLKSFPDAWTHNSNSSLVIFEIRDCPSLTYITRAGLPPTLKRLVIRHCHSLKSLIKEDDIHSSSKGVWECSKLASLSSSGHLPDALETLLVVDCPKLESIAERIDNSTCLEDITVSSCKNVKCLPSGLHMLRHLQEFTIYGSPLVTFPEGGLLSPKLTSLYITLCQNLEALPLGIRNLTSLQRLAIKECPRIGSFTGDALPANLSSLAISGLNIWKPLSEWGLNRFSSLKELSLRACPNVVSFPQALPASLTELQIEDFPDLERLSSLSVTSLESLILKDCLRLRYFPENGFPTSLLKLYIRRCPLIEERCRKNDGDYWDFIIPIPYVEVNYRWVFKKSSTEDWWD